MKHLKTVRNWIVQLEKIPVSPVKKLDNQDIFGWIVSKIERIGEKEKLIGEILEKVIYCHRSIKGRKEVIVHGDLNPSNIFLDKNNIYIYDWEYARVDLPLLDYFHFICSYFKLFDIKKLFFEKNPLSDVIYEEIREYFNELKIDKKDMYNFFIVSLFNYLIKESYFNIEIIKQRAKLFLTEDDNIFLWR